MSLYEEVVAAFAAPHVDLADLPEGDPTAAVGRACENLFTGGVDVLRSIVPGDRLRALGRVVWDLVGHKRVLTALGPDVPSLAFTVMRVKGIDQAIIFFPKTWPQMVADDPFMQLGAIVFVGAQAVDFFNDRLVGDPSARVRWQAYEAELLLSLQRTLPTWSANAYQRQVVARYPRGLDSPGVELYPVRGYEPPQGAA